MIETMHPKELIAVFLDNLYPANGAKPTDEDAIRALNIANEEYLSRVLPFEDMKQELVDLYDSARDYNVAWPQPLGQETYKAVKDREFYRGDDMSGLQG